MGVVYRARDGSGRDVALKLLSTELAKDPTWVQRFENEAAACAQLAHPNTVRLHGCGRSRAGRLWLAMELLEGRTLRGELANGPLPARRVVDLLVQVCPALDEAHGRGIIHRDIKPDNLFLLAGDRVKVLDFSVAKLKQQAAHGLQTAAGVVFGTPQYMSPEQGRGFPVDARSDLYSLGIVAYEMLSGVVPFTSSDPMEVLAAHVQRPLPPLPATVPPALGEVIVRMLSKDPAARHASARDVQAALERALPPPPPPPAPAPIARTTVQVASGATPLLWVACIVGGVAIGLLGYFLIDRLS
jgi:serine/threonine-protein kinase